MVDLVVTFNNETMKLETDDRSLCKTDRPHRAPTDTTATTQERCLGWGFSTGLRLLSATWRIETEGLETLQDLAQRRDRHVLVFWHRHYVALFGLFRRQPIIALTNRSHRGQVIANMCRRNGVRPVQLVQTGKRQMLRSLENVVDDGLGIGITVDGPLGPACKAKPVVMHLASRLGMTVVPISVAVRRKYAIANRWDQMEIPCPFSPISFVIGEPFQISPTETRDGLREWAIVLTAAINRGTAHAKARLGDR